MATGTLLGQGKATEMDETTSGRSWLRVAYKWLMPVALVAAISVAAVTVISAASDDGFRLPGGELFSDGERNSGDDDHDCDGDKGHRGHGKFGASVTELAELLGTDRDGLKTALSEGMTVAQIAEANGVEVQSVIDALVERVGERIDAWVEAGKLTDEEAETKKSEAAAKIEDIVNNGFDKENFRGWGKARGRGHGYGHGLGSVETS